MIELLTTTQMAEADRLTIAGGTAGIDLMENAGRAVADCAAEHYPEARRVTVVCGRGNNGGDGFIVARVLAERGRAVRILLMGEGTDLKGDAAEAARRWTGRIEPMSPAAIPECDLLIDAMFGAGLDRAIEGIAAATIEAINRSGLPVVAVDLPSGISGDTGEVMGCAVRAERTVTFFRRKPGHLLLPGRMNCGSLHLVDIGIAPTVLDSVRPCLYANEPALWQARLPVPGVGGNKYDRGHAVVLSGGMASTGAARLAARGALRAGAGLVTIASPREALAINAAANTAVMVAPIDGRDELSEFLADRRRNVAVLGPGGGVGSAMRKNVRAALGSEAAVVLDADALTSFADDPTDLIKAIGRRRSPVVLTPHGGEFYRLFSKLNEFSNSKVKLEMTRGAAQAAGAVVLLKGADTVVSRPDGVAAIASNAPPWLATAGAGDVLAGIIAGLLAQGMPAFEAATAGVWLHGEAARTFGLGLIAEDLPEALPAVLQRLSAT